MGGLLSSFEAGLRIRPTAPIGLAVITRTLMMIEGATADPNKHVKAFIAYYAALPQAPRYAVMLNGA